MTTDTTDEVSEDNELLWDHLVKISELVQRTQNRSQSLSLTTRKSDNMDPLQPPQLQSIEGSTLQLRQKNNLLELENKELRNDVAKLREEIRVLKNQITTNIHKLTTTTTVTGKGDGIVLTQETEFSDTDTPCDAYGEDSHVEDETEISPMKSQSQSQSRSQSQSQLQSQSQSQSQLQSRILQMEDAERFNVPLSPKKMVTSLSAPTRKLIDVDVDVDDQTDIRSSLITARRTVSDMKRNRLFEDYLDTPEPKRVLQETLKHTEPHVEDSQGSDSILNGEEFRTSLFYDAIKVKDPIRERECEAKKEKMNFSQNPTLERPWYPEDFIKNPKFERYINDRSVHLNSLPTDIREFYIRQKEHLRAIATRSFKDLTKETQRNLYSDPFTPEDEDVEEQQQKDTKHASLITPLQDPEYNFTNLPISSTIKFEINKSNYQTYLRYYPNILRTNKVRAWDIEDSKDINDVCGDFLLTQEVQNRNEKAREKSRIRALQMLFQACFNVKDGKQVGSYVFRKDELNMRVCNGGFVIDIGIFQQE
jgi:hypothetical protein